MDLSDGHAGEAGDRSVYEHMSRWIELFYDLIFVAAILIFSTAVAHVHPQAGIVWIVVVFAASWWVWFSTTVSANRFHMADFPHRALLLFQMLVIVLMAMEARVTVSGDSHYLVVEYAVLLCTVAVIYLRAARRPGPDARFAGRLAAVNGGAAALFLLAATLPESGRLAAAAAGFVLLVLLSVVLVHGLDPFSHRDEEHLVERMAAFTLIVCGESFVEVAISVSRATIRQLDLVSLAFEFVLVFAIFTSYFEDVPAAGLNQRRLGWWAAFHLAAQVSIAGTAVSVSKLVDLNVAHHLPDAEILRLTVPLASLYLAMAGIGACTRRRPLEPLLRVRLTTAAVVVLVGVAAWWIPPIHMAEALPLLAAVAVLDAARVVHNRGRTALVDRPVASPT